MENKTINPTSLLRDETFKLRDADQSTVERLAVDIMGNGITHPLLVRENKGRYQLLDGRIRCLAAVMAGMDVPVQVVDATDLKAWALAVGANIHRQDFTGFDKYRICAKLREVGLTVDQAAKVAGIESPRFYAVQQIGTYPPLVDALRAGKMGLEACVVTAKALHARQANPVTVRQVVGEVKAIGRVPDPDTLNALIDGVVGTTNRREETRQRYRDNGRVQKVFIFNSQTPRPQLRRMLRELDAIKDQITALLGEADRVTVPIRAVAVSKSKEKQPKQ